MIYLRILQSLLSSCFLGLFVCLGLLGWMAFAVLGQNYYLYRSAETNAFYPGSVGKYALTAVEDTAQPSALSVERQSFSQIQYRKYYFQKSHSTTSTSGLRYNHLKYVNSSHHLVLSEGDQMFRINVENYPRLRFSYERYYQYFKSSNEYSPIRQENISAGDVILREGIYRPGTQIQIFGKLLREEENPPYRDLIFYEGIEFTKDNFWPLIKSLPQDLLHQRHIVLEITDDPKAASSLYFWTIILIGLFSFVFSLVPILMIIRTWRKTISTLFGSGT